MQSYPDHISTSVHFESSYLVSVITSQCNCTIKLGLKTPNIRPVYVEKRIHTGAQLSKYYLFYLHSETGYVILPLCPKQLCVVCFAGNLETPPSVISMDRSPSPIHSLTRSLTTAALLPAATFCSICWHLQIIDVLWFLCCFSWTVTEHCEDNFFLYTVWSWKKKQKLTQVWKCLLPETNFGCVYCIISAALCLNFFRSRWAWL